MPGLKSKIKKTVSVNKIKPVTTINDLKYKCDHDELKEKYQQLAIISAQNLGCPQSKPTLEEAFKWLDVNAMETSEDGSDEGVVGEINFCIDLVK